MSDRGGDFDIYVMELGGGNVTQVTDDRGNDFNMRANGKDPAQLTHNTATDSIPDWQRLFRGRSAR